MSWITNYLFKSTLGSQDHQLFDLALKSLIVMLTNGLLFAAEPSNNSKFDNNVSNSSDNWLGER